MRTYSHIIDTKSIKKLLNSFPDHWVVRELSERDYGTDLVVEIFVENGVDKNGRTAYETSGCLCNIQVKGTNEELIVNKDNSIHFSFSKSALEYVERFAIPFLLVRVNVSDESSDIYFVWLQRYIKDVLESEYDNWREEQQKTFTLKMPIENTISNNLEKIENIAFRLKYVEELVEFKEIYEAISPMLTAIGSGQHPLDDEVYIYIRNQLKKVLRLYVLLSRNACCINAESIYEVLNALTMAHDDQSILSTLIDYPDKYNLDLLCSSIGNISALEQSIADNVGEFVY